MPCQGWDNKEEREDRCFLIFGVPEGLNELPCSSCRIMKDDRLNRHGLLRPKEVSLLTRSDELSPSGIPLGGSMETSSSENAVLFRKGGGKNQAFEYPLPDLCAGFRTRNRLKSCRSLHQQQRFFRNFHRHSNRQADSDSKHQRMLDLYHHGGLLYEIDLWIPVKLCQQFLEPPTRRIVYFEDECRMHP